MSAFAKAVPALALGTDVYYSGDQANDPGYFIASNGTFHTLQEHAGGSRRQFCHVPDTSVARDYAPYSIYRFVVQASRDAYRTAQIDGLRAAMRRSA